MEAPEVAIERALVRGTRATRYNREWFLGPVMEQSEDEHRLLQGRIGFERVAGATELWDDSKKDFTFASVREGATSPFALNLSDRLIAFQLRSGTIKRTSFTGAFAALMNEASSYDGWTVEPLLPEATFTSWQTRVRRVMHAVAVVNEPNPRYEQEDVEELLTKTRARRAKLELTGENLSVTENELLRQMIEHVDRDDRYGYYKFEGMTEDQRRTSFDSREDAAPTEATAAVDPATNEVPFDSLRRAAVEPPNESPPTQGDG